MLGDGKSKEELEKIYNKGRKFRDDNFSTDFSLKTKDIKVLNDKIQYEKVTQERYDDSENEDEESEIQNIEVTNLLSSDQSTINKKYQSPLKNIESRIRWLRGILVVMHIISVTYFTITVSVFSFLLDRNKYISPNAYNSTYFDYQASGLKTLFGSPLVSLCIYYTGTVSYLLHMLISFIGTQTYDPENQDQVERSIFEVFSPQFTLKLREKIVLMFKSFALLYSLGCLVQLFFYHYRKGLLQFLKEEQQVGEFYLLLFFSTGVIIIQVMKVTWNLLIVFFTLRLKQYSIKYAKDINHYNNARV